MLIEIDGSMMPARSMSPSNTASFVYVEVGAEMSDGITTNPAHAVEPRSKPHVIVENDFAIWKVDDGIVVAGVL